MFIELRQLCVNHLIEHDNNVIGAVIGVVVVAVVVVSNYYNTIAIN
jgi:hypothetical protein